MHFALLIGYGASAVNPYLALETVAAADDAEKADLQLHQGHQQRPAEDLLQDGHLHPAELSRRAGLRSHRPEQGARSTSTSPAPPRASKASASTCWPRRPSCKHRYAFAPQTDSDTELGVGGNYQYRARGEYHLYNPQTIAKLQHAVRQESFADLPGVHRPARQAERASSAPCAACSKSRRPPNPVPLDEVEPASEIVKRFATGAMSLRLHLARKRTRPWPSP